MALTASFQTELAAQKGLEIKCQNPDKNGHGAPGGGWGATGRTGELRKGQGHPILSGHSLRCQDPSPTRPPKADHGTKVPKGSIPFQLGEEGKALRKNIQAGELRKAK